MRCVFLLIYRMRQLPKRCGKGWALPAKMKWRAVGGKRPRFIELIISVARIFRPSGNLYCKQKAGHLGKLPGRGRQQPAVPRHSFLFLDPSTRPRLFTFAHLRDSSKWSESTSGNAKFPPTVIANLVRAIVDREYSADLPMTTTEDIFENPEHAFHEP